MNKPIYETIGAGYSSQRIPDPLWEEHIGSLLSEANMILNVGAGTGSYEPAGKTLIALDPSLTMLGQRGENAAPSVCGTAESLPFTDNSFDASLAILTVHHWTDYRAGLTEMKRVSGRQHVVTWDPQYFAESFWLVRDYLPEAIEREQDLAVATVSEVTACFNDPQVSVLPVDAHCTDGFFGAYWRRPEAYLDPAVRQSISGLALLEPKVIDPAMKRLEQDIDSGLWHEKYQDLLALEVIDLGYRILSA